MLHMQSSPYIVAVRFRIPHYKIGIHSDTRIEHTPDSIRWVERTDFDSLYAGHNTVDQRRMARSDGDSGRRRKRLRQRKQVSEFGSESCSNWECIV